MHEVQKMSKDAERSKLALGLHLNNGVLQWNVGTGINYIQTKIQQSFASTSNDQCFMLNPEKIDNNLTGTVRR